MKLNTFTFLADENIPAKIILFLKTMGIDTLSANEVLLNGKADETIVDFAFANKRVILTQDSDFGNILFTTNKKVFGIVFLRPGIIQKIFTF